MKCDQATFVPAIIPSKVSGTIFKMSQMSQFIGLENICPVFPTTKLSDPEIEIT